MRLKILFSASVLLYINNVQAQEHHHRQLDRLNEKTIERYLKRLDEKICFDSEINMDSIYTGRAWINVKHLFDSLHVRLLSKGDLNGDGVTDILAVGQCNGAAQPICLIGHKMHPPKLINFRRGFGPQYFLPTIVNAHGKDYILNTEIENPRYLPDSRSGEVFATDTLTYAYNGLIELNRCPRDNKIEKIEFRTTQCFGKCPVFSLIIDKHGYTIYHPQLYNYNSAKEEIKGTYHALLREKDYLEIVGILNYMDFPRLDTSYWVNWTDDQTSILTITYKNSQVKQIVDYGGLGTFGLHLLYSKIWALRKTYSWVSE